MSRFNIETAHGSKGTTFHITLVGADELMAKLNRINKDFRAEAGRSMVAAGAFIIEGKTKVNINQTFSSKNVAGLEGSVFVEVSQSKPEASVEVRKIYARIQEFGGTIVPRKAKVLHWVQDGKDIFAKSVTLPPRPYFRPAIESSEAEVIKAMSDVADVYLRKA